MDNNDGNKLVKPIPEGLNLKDFEERRKHDEFKQRHVQSQLESFEVVAKQIQKPKKLILLPENVFISPTEQKVAESHLKEKYNWMPPQQQGKIVLRRDTVFVHHDGKEELLERSFDLSYEGQDMIDNDVKEKIKTREERAFELREKYIDRYSKHPRRSGRRLMTTAERHSEYEEEYYKQSFSARKRQTGKEKIETFLEVTTGNIEQSEGLPGSSKSNDNMGKKQELLTNTNDLQESDKMQE